MADDGVGLRWGVERRLAFLDACLYWADRVNRADLVREFGVSAQQASADLARYMSLAPKNAVYDRNRKTYARGLDFEPLLRLPSAREVLGELGHGDAEVGSSHRYPWSDVVAEQAVPRTQRKLDTPVVKALLTAVREGYEVEVEYRSFAAPGTSVRWMAPHAFVDGGDRWHVRAYCRQHNDFRDFVVSRVVRVLASRRSDVPTSADAGWTNHATLELAPNPGLEPERRRALEIEHGMEAGKMCMRVRTCFAYYVIGSLGLDLPDDVTAPRRKHLVLVNPKEVSEAQEIALAETRERLSATAARALCQIFQAATTDQTTGSHVASRDLHAAR